jgi:hypothetical protein
MTIDERLQKLSERHEAITRTLELLAREMRESRAFMHDIAEGTVRLLQIAQIHEQRITGLDGGES